MTLSSDLSRVSYAGDGATGVFAVPFYFLDADDPKVILRDAAGGETAWTHGTHYTVSGAGSPTGGTLTVATSPTDYTPAGGETLVILRRVPLTQETDYTEGDPLPAATLERDFDKARMIDQQLAETLGRTLKFADSSTVSGLTVPEPAADQVMKWNTAADGLENWATVADIAAVAGVADDIDTLGPIAANIATLAGIAGNVTTVATHVADVTNFADVYVGPAAGDPTTRADSSALQAGDLYFNTTAEEMRVYDGAAWQAAYLPSASYLTAADNLSDLADAATARSNLSLGTAAVLAAASGAGDLMRTDTLSIMSQAEAEAGTSTTQRGITAERIRQAIAAQAAGTVLQVVYAELTTSGTATNAHIPFDDTIPQNTEGAEMMTASITPQSATSKLFVEVFAIFGENVNIGQGLAAALFRDSGANALAVAPQPGWGGAHNAFSPGHEFFSKQFGVVVASGSTAETTFKVRIGGNVASSSVRWNGVYSSRQFGGALKSWIKITEYEP